MNLMEHEVMAAPIGAAAAGDTISRQLAIKEIEKYHITSGVKHQNTWNECVMTIAKTLKDLPAAPVEPIEDAVVRCKGCKEWDTSWNPTASENVHYCPMIDLSTDGNFYCGWGARKNG